MCFADSALLRSVVHRSTIVALVIASTTSMAFAQAPASSSSAWRERYPSASIDSTARADDALAAAKVERTRVERDYRDTSRACMDRFMVNDCLNAARDSQRRRLADVDAVEVEANRFKRRDRANRQDAERREREAARAASATETPEERAPAALEERDARRPGGSSKSRASTGTAMKDSGPDAARRAKNVAAYEEKRKDAAEHRRQLDARRSERETDRARRAAERAAKNAAAGQGPAASPATASAKGG